MSSPFHSKVVPVLSRVLRERDALVRLIERMELYADHRPGCVSAANLPCSCLYGQVADDAAVLIDRIKREQGR